MKYSWGFMFIALLFACKKEHVNEYIGPTNNNTAPQMNITYPDSLNGHINVTSRPNYETFYESDTLEVGADLETDAHLKLVITNYPATDSLGNHTGWMYSNATGFTVSDYDTVTNTQTLTSNSAGKIYMQINFLAYGIGGQCKIDYYENTTLVTKTRTYQWH